MKTYTTVAGDTWDKIALDQLGSEYLFPLILSENQKHRNVLIFSDGITLIIPEISEDEDYEVPVWLSGDFDSETDVGEDPDTVEEETDSDGIITVGDESDS